MSTVFLKLKTMLPVVSAPDTRSPAVAIVLAVTVTPEVPPTAVGTALVPALSTVKLLAAEVVEAVTVNVGDAARSAGPFVLVTVKALPVNKPTEPGAPAAVQEAVGVE